MAQAARKAMWGDALLLDRADASRGPRRRKRSDILSRQELEALAEEARISLSLALPARMAEPRPGPGRAGSVVLRGAGEEIGGDRAQARAGTHSSIIPPHLLLFSARAKGVFICLVG